MSRLRARISLFGLALAFSGLAAAGSRADETAPVPEIRPGFLKGYLSKEALPDSAALLPPPPAVGSAAQALDLDIARASLALRETPRWQLAVMDANLNFPDAAGDFSCAL
jgi:acid phosphatase (class A)